jgi:hypothetical protein
LLAESSCYPEVPKPILAKRGQLLKATHDGLANALEFAARKITPGPGAVLILIDSEGTCPAQLGPTLLARARTLRSDLAIHVVLAHTMFEAWFLAAAGSLAGQRGLPQDLTDHKHPEGVQNPKAWLDGEMPRTRKYSETADQPALTQMFDLQGARRCPSFDKFCRELAAITLLNTIPL